MLSWNATPQSQSEQTPVARPNSTGRVWGLAVMAHYTYKNIILQWTESTLDKCKLGWCWNAIANCLIGFQASPVYIGHRGVKSGDGLTGDVLNSIHCMS